MANVRIPENELPVKQFEEDDYLRVVAASGKSYRVARAEVIGQIETEIEEFIGEATTSEAGLMSAADKQKLDGLENVTVDDELSTTSENPVQNKVIAETVADLENDITDIKEDFNDTAPVILNSASGSIAHFEDGSDAPVKDLKITIEPVQSGSGDPSPTNVRPITGHTQATVTRTGVNVWDEEWESGAILNGEPVSSPTTIRSKNFSACRPSSSYYVKSSMGLRIHWYDIAKTWIEMSSSIANSSITAPNNAYFFKLGFTSNYGTTYNNDTSINYPSTDTSYHAYSGQTITIDLDGTRYGGTLDVTSGVLTVDRAMVDLGSLTWTYRSSGYNSKPFYAHIDNPKLPTHTSVIIPALCSIYRQVAANQTNSETIDKVFAISKYFSGSHELNVIDQSYTDVTTFTNAMNGQMLVYQLDTPLTVQLVGQDLTTLYGTNNIWADTGDTTVEYRADTKLYIEQLTKPTEDDMVANTAIASGTYFMVGNRLFLSTATIASGDTINPGTNCTEMSLADALNNV